MASEPVNEEQNDERREKQSYRVYTRKGRGPKKETSSTDVAETAATGHRGNQEENVKVGSVAATAIESKEEKQNRNSFGNNVSIEAPPQTLGEDVDCVVIDKHSVEAPTETLAREDVVSAVVNKNPIEPPTKSLTPEHVDTVVDKNPIEGPSQFIVREDVNPADVNKNSVEDLQTLVLENINIVVVDKEPVEVPSQPLAEEYFNNIVVDKNSIEASHQTLALEDINDAVGNLIDVSPHYLAREDSAVLAVDKNSTKATDKTLDQGDINSILGNLNQVSCHSLAQEDVTTVVVDKNSIKASGHSLAQQDVNLAAQQAGYCVEVREQSLDGRIRRNLAPGSRQRKRELREKLQIQLDLVRGLESRIQAKEAEISGYANSGVLLNASVNNEGGRIHLGMGSTRAPREVIRLSRPLNQLNMSVLENLQGVNEHVEKEKRTPKANQFYRNSEFLLAKDKFPPAESNKKLKQSARKQGAELGHGFGPGSKVFKNCSALLERLMKHKHGWVFNAPVDVKGLGLHDYFSIIKRPMDLGTIKSRLTKNWYKSPREFAEDVRLTFRNAMTYNPKGQDVHLLAEQLSNTFEDKWAIIEADYNREMRFVADYEMNLLTPRSRQASMMPSAPTDVRSMVDKSELSTRPIDPQPKPTRITVSGRTPALKKPKANETNKRDMTYEEKQKLSINLQNLPPEKLDQIVHIVKKRNSAVNQRDDEIEVDIDNVDPETLWELDRLITNYKKSLSKKKRKAELAIQARAEAEKYTQEQKQTTAQVQNGNTASEKNVPATLPSQSRIQNGNSSRSSSSSGSTSDSSSSSSDSDSDSSSSSRSDQT